MKKKNVFKISAILLIVIGVVLILLSFLVSDQKEMKPDDKTNNDGNVEVKPSTPDEERPPLTYKEVLDMAVSLYGGEGFSIEVIEEDDKFIIERTYSSNGNTEVYFVDKVTGSIYSEDPPAFG